MRVSNNRKSNLARENQQRLIDAGQTNTFLYRTRYPNGIDANLPPFFVPDAVINGSVKLNPKTGEEVI